MMRFCFIIIISILFSCSSKKNNIEGVWKISNKFYKATCKISRVKEHFQALVLDYNDGTSKYTYNKTNEKYLFKNVKLNYKGNTEFDGMSGATNKSKNQSGYMLELLGNDTLKVSSGFEGKTLTEIWVRVKL